MNGVTGVPASTFTTIAHQIAMDYEIERPNVNLSGEIMESYECNGLILHISRRL